MRVPVAVAQVPVCWSVRRNVGTVLDAIGAVGPGTVLVLPECALGVSWLGVVPAVRQLDDRAGHQQFSGPWLVSYIVLRYNYA